MISNHNFPPITLVQTIENQIHNVLNIINTIANQNKLTVSKKSKNKLIKCNKHLNQLTLALMFFKKYPEFTSLNDNLEKSPTSNIMGTPLIWAIRTQNEEVVDYLLRQKNIDVNLTDSLGRTAAWWAAHHCQADVIEKLVKHNANLFIADIGEVTPLSEALHNGAQTAIAHIVSQFTGYSLYKYDAFGNPLFHSMAATKEKPSQVEQTKIIQTLMRLGLDINEQNNNGQTPLMVAMKNKHYGFVDNLLQCGADPSILDKSQDNFIDYFDDNDRFKLQKILKKNGLRAYLIELLEEVKEFGHVLGIGTFLKLGQNLGYGGVIQVPIDPNGKMTIPVFTEGTTRKTGLMIIQDTLKHYEALDQEPELQKISDAYSQKEKSVGFKGNPIKLTHHYRTLYQKYQNGELIVIDPLYPGHGIGVALYKDKLILTDRFPTSGGKFSKCTKIFNIDNKLSFSLFSLLVQCSVVSIQQDKFKQILSKFLNINQPLFEIGDNAQMHGTCVYVNPRSNIEGILAVLLADKVNNLKNTSPEQKWKIPQKEIQHVLEVAHQIYREFLYNTRTAKIKKLVKKLNRAFAINDPPIVAMYLEIAEGFIRGHKSKHKNEGNDWDNVGELITGLNPPLKEALLARCFPRWQHDRLVDEFESRFPKNNTSSSKNALRR